MNDVPPFGPGGAQGLRQAFLAPLVNDARRGGGVDRIHVVVAPTLVEVGEPVLSS